jgi:hypothetical protein
MKNKTSTILTTVGFCLVAVIAGMSTIRAQENTSGTVTLESKSVAVGVGVSWGDGILEFRGAKYPFTVSGLSVVDVGVSKVSARGEVRNLRKIEDFSGNFVAAGTGAAVGGGVGVAALKNQQGVEMTLTATTQGVKFAFAGAGVEVKLKK